MNRPHATELLIRLVLVSPPKDVTFAVQEGQELVHETRSSGKTISFDLAVQVKEKDGEPRLAGPFVQGPAGAKFVYVNSGSYAGDKKASDGRRAKVPLSIAGELIEKAMKTKGAVLEARIGGTAKDGGPVCASVPLLDGWKVIRARGK